MLSGLFVGMVLGLQGYQLLARFGSEEALGTAAAIGLVKELSPVVTAIFADLALRGTLVAWRNDRSLGGTGDAGYTASASALAAALGQEGHGEGTTGGPGT